MIRTKKMLEARAVLKRKLREQQEEIEKQSGTARPTPKMLAAGDALDRINQQLRRLPEPRTAKMQAAREALEREIEKLGLQSRGKKHRSLAKRLLAKLAFEDRYIAERQRLRLTEMYEPLACVSKIDRVVVTASNVNLAAIGALPGYVVGTEGPLWNQSYRKATPVRGSGSIYKVSVESKPWKTCYPPYRVVIYPQDDSGAQPQDLALILRQLTKPRLQLIEVAFDFPADSVVDSEFVQNHGVFGKSDPHSVGQTIGYDNWGSRKGSKFVKSYFKGEIFAHRVELEFHGSDLRKYGITEVSDFQKFAALLPDQHIYFGRINHAALVHRLVSRGFSADRIHDIRQKVRNLEWNLCAALNYLRQEVGLDNVTRLLTPLDDVNQVEKEAIEKWASEWCKNSMSLEKKT